MSRLLHRRRDPPNRFAAVTAITKLTGLVGQRCAPDGVR